MEDSACQRFRRSIALSEFRAIRFFRQKMVYIAVDGPAGSGKSATFQRVAEQLGYKFIDTGLFYRAFCWSVVNHSELRDAVGDEGKMTEALKKWTIRFGQGDDQVFVKWSDAEKEAECGSELHSHDIDQNVSQIALHPSVRTTMVELQRTLAKESQPCIVLGRDIGSVVLPDAPLKIYMTTSIVVRAQRRFKQIADSGVTFEQVYDEIRRRDQTDKTRPVGPLVQTPDAVVLANDKLSIDEAVEAAIKIIREKVSNATAS